MKITRKLNDTTTIEAEGKTVAEVHAALASLEEIFSIDTCGVCGHQGVRYQVRTDDDDHKFHMAICGNPECKAEFRFGLKEGGQGILFPQRKYPTKGNPPHPRAGEWKPDGGWAIWRPSGEGETPPPFRQAPPPPKPADRQSPTKTLSPAEAAANLEAYDTKLASEGLFAKGDLVNAVIDAAGKCGYSSDPLKWGPDAYDVARKATKAYVDHARARKPK